MSILTQELHSSCLQGSKTELGSLVKQIWQTSESSSFFSLEKGNKKLTLRSSILSLRFPFAWTEWLYLHNGWTFLLSFCLFLSELLTFLLLPNLLLLASGVKKGTQDQSHLLIWAVSPLYCTLFLAVQWKLSTNWPKLQPRDTKTGPNSLIGSSKWLWTFLCSREDFLWTLSLARTLCSLSVCLLG